jgi:splicing factor 3B subunit 2
MPESEVPNAENGRAVLRPHRFHTPVTHRPHSRLDSPVYPTNMSVAVQHMLTPNGLNGTSSESKKAKSRNQLRRQKAKQKKAATQVRLLFNTSTPAHNPRDVKATPGFKPKKEEDDHQEYENVEYVSEQLDLKGAALEAFSDVFARFQYDPEDRPVRGPS